MCPELLEELSEVIARPKFKKYILQDIGHIIESITLFTEMAVAPAPYPECPDPDDAYLFALTKANNAILVTGDKALLNAALSDIKRTTFTEFKNFFK
ncbi:putative toxin-antitoxin system toxin component, PIN family [Taibaiella soli]|uniref:putative toxin-antitoxin system toxin component, PIN family n=1 Tax=Taibaiella soli TaxID=1649169 RepID=UPI0014021B8C